jgi:arylsulfatase
MDWPVEPHAPRIRRVPIHDQARNLLVASVALWCGACGADERAAAPPVEPRPPSVLLLTLDTLRADHLGVYGYPEPISPNIDALAARGVVYERAIAASSRTAPSHASILTSRYVRDHAVGSVNGATRLEHETTLASLLSGRGYDTAAFVSNSVLQRRTGLDKGFALYDDELPETEANRGRIFERRAPETAARALAWLDRARGPWLLWVHFNDPHGPYDAPPHDRHPSLSGVARGTMNGQLEVALPVLEDQSGRGGIPAYQALDDLRLPRAYRARYATEIRFMDDSVGRLLAGAERAAGEAGLVIALTADHGESQGE